jgi:hypothetical protein
MGLSDEERIRGVLVVVGKVSKLLDDWKRENGRNPVYELEPLLGLLEEMWPATLEGQTNGDAWLWGSPSNSPITRGSMSPWAVAVSRQLEEAVGERGKVIESKTYDVIEHCSVENLLGAGHCGPEGFVFRVYREMEALAYYLRRYDDELRKDLRRLDALVSDVMGRCFVWFEENEAFAKAYVLHDIMEMVYTVGYIWKEEKDWDVVTRVCMESIAHHDFVAVLEPGSGWGLEELCRIHVELLGQRAKAKPGTRGEEWARTPKMLEARFEAAVALVGHRWGKYPHTLRPVLSMLGKSPLRGKVRRLKARVVRLYEEKLKGRREWGKEQASSAFEAYGYAANDLERKWS